MSRFVLVRCSLSAAATVAFLVCISIAGSTEVAFDERIAAAADDLSPDVPYTVAQPQNVQASFDDFSWRSFVALNWPVAMDGESPKRGVPDRSKSIGDLSVPRVWESWKADYELFQNGGLAPSPWDSFQAEDPTLNKPDAGHLLTRPMKVLPLIAKGTAVLNGTFNQAMAGPLIDQKHHYVRYEIRLNRRYYDFVRENALYLRSNLAKYEWPNAKLDLPASTQGQYGVIEIKAAWRDMRDATPEEMKRYYISQALVPKAQDPQEFDKVPVGLVGLHIAHKTAPFSAWVWATFEQVDNVPDNEKNAVAPYSFSSGNPDETAKQNGYSPANAWRPRPPGPMDPSPQPVEVVRLNPVRASASKANARYQKLLAGTVWQYYKLIDTQWPTRPDLQIVPHNPKKSGDIYNSDDAQHGQPATPEGKGGCQVPEPPDNVANITMEAYFQGRGATQRLKNFGSSCMHCHYRTAQSDFSWVLEDLAHPRPRTSIFAKETEITDTSTVNPPPGNTPSGSAPRASAPPADAPRADTSPGAWNDAQIVEISSDQSAIQVQHRLGDGSSEGPPLTLAVRSPELKATLKGFEKGDRVELRYKQESGQNELQSLAVKVQPEGAVARVLALLLTAILLLFFFWILLRSKITALILGADNRYSKSKFQMVVWFFVLVVTYIATIWFRGHSGGADFVGGVNIPQNLLLLSGFSALTFATAKGITQSKVEKAQEEGKSAKTTAVSPKFPDDLFRDDAGRVDMADFQMIIVTLLAVVVYVVRVFGFLGSIELHRQVALPDVDTTILATFGLGQGAYLAKKYVGDIGGGKPDVAKAPQAAGPQGDTVQPSG